jgi:agmatinase
VHAGIEVIGVPSDSGNGAESGGRFGPEAIRRASLGLPSLSFDGVDHGDVDCVAHCDWPEVLAEVQGVIQGMASRGSLPVVLGGDHAISYAAVAALQGAAPVNILWLDAHTDFCRWPGGQSHNHKQVLRRINGLGHVGRILQIGHRGIAYFDESRLSEKMRVITAGAARTLSSERLLEFFPADQAVYISIDIDAVDPTCAPGTGHPVPGGLSAALVSGIARTVISNRDVVGLDMMEVNPLLDHQDITSMAAANILREVLATFAQGRRSKHEGESDPSHRSRRVPAPGSAPSEPVT